MSKSKETPMMQQYNEIKAQYPDAFLFYRLGDFYELFNDDAIQGSQILELTLTQRNKNSDHPVPMAGVPHHAAQNYIDILVDKGYKVAVVEQMEDPAQAEGMVKREVVQLVTPGTRMSEGGEAAKENNYLVAIAAEDAQNYGFAYTDLSTGELKTTRLTSTTAVLNELARLDAKEVVSEQLLPSDLAASLTNLGIMMSTQILSEELPTAQKSLVQDLSVLEGHAALLLITYLFSTQKRSLDHLQPVQSYTVAQYLKMDRNSRANLELTTNLRTQQRSGTLLWLLDETQTAMGARLLKQWLEQPLIDQANIEARYDKIAGLMSDFIIHSDLQKGLKSVYDLERLVGRVAYGTANGRDLLQIRNSLRQVPVLIQSLKQLDPAIFGEMITQLDPVADLEQLISQAIVDEPPLSVTDGGIIRDSYNETLDQYRHVLRDGKQWLVELEQAEREATGINSLKIGYNKVFGYYIEITKANIAKLDSERYTRKQTLTNAERFVTPELKAHEEEIMNAETHSSQLEYTLFTELRDEIKNNIERLQRLAKKLAELDVLCALAQVAQANQLVRPQLNRTHTLKITQGRHPVVEKVLGYQSYVANDIVMDPQQMIMLITGPNMSGKSTYMRQLALTIIMAQIGSFVPAAAAEIPIFDQIFTRIGAADDLISGNSTFMVEMAEANTALQDATEDSLILLDELGRGTATFDGMALAQAIIEYVHQNVHAKTLFSTHYHELTVLDEQLPQLFNMHVGAHEENGQLIFSHRILPGAADQSYGINVAKLAGLPDSLTTRASVILKQLEQESQQKVDADQGVKVDASNSDTVEVLDLVKEQHPEEKSNQLDLFAPEEPNSQERTVAQRVQNVDLSQTTPLEALLLLAELQKINPK